MISVDDALRIVLQNTSRLDDCEVEILDALDHVLAEDIPADMDMPPFDKSAMDGFAVLARNVTPAPVELQIVEEIPAGRFPTKKITDGKTSRIMTGAPIPEGADAVVMVEFTEKGSSPDTVRILKPVEKAGNICFRGEDMRQGEVILKEGTLVRPPEIGVLSAAGSGRVRVFRRPTVAVLTTGDELVDMSAKPRPGQIRDSNGYSISAQAMRKGLAPDYLGISPDDPESLRRAFSRGLAYDLFLITGGVSVGDFDYSEKVISELGVEILFDRVAIKPGKPLVFGKKGKTLLFGLPGNPVSTYVTFEVFVAPAIFKMMGRDPLAAHRSRRTKARLTKGIKKVSERTQYLPGTMSATPAEADALSVAPLESCGTGVSPVEKHGQAEAGALSVAPLEWHGSADLFSVTRGNCFIIVPSNAGPLPPGSVVDVLPIE